MPLDETPYPLTVSFDYPPGVSLEDMTAAMSAFRHAFSAYARSGKATLTVESFEPGSLRCNLLADRPGYLGMHAMAKDLRLLSHGHRAPLMPDGAKKHLRRAVALLNRIDVSVDDIEVNLDKGSEPLLQGKTSPLSSQSTEKAGVVDRIDLKANQFRLMLANGHRITCTPCAPFLNDLSAAIVAVSPRILVEGQAKYSGSGLLPVSIQVRSVTRLPIPDSFEAMVSRIASREDWGPVFDRISEIEGRIDAEHDTDNRGERE